MPVVKTAPPSAGLPEGAAQRRLALTNQIADIVLREGLDVLALRGLAERLNTSARMLMYYFGSKETLVIDAVRRIVQRLQLGLHRFATAERVPAGQFLASAMALASDPEIAPFMRVLTELIARGARRESPYDDLAEELVAAWVSWIESRLLEPAEPGQAASVLAIVEGMTLLEQASKGSTRSAGPYLVEVFKAADRR